MSTDPFSLESTVSVESPRTPDPFSDSIELCLPMSSESDVIRQLNETIEKLKDDMKKQKEDHDKEIKRLNDDMKKSKENQDKKINALKDEVKDLKADRNNNKENITTLTDDLEAQKKDAANQIKKLAVKVKKVESENGLLKTEVKNNRKALMADTFDPFIKSLSPNRINARMENIIQSCKGKKQHEISEILFKSKEDPQELLRKLETYLTSKGDDPVIHSRIVSLFLRVGFRGLTPPKQNPKQNPRGTNNQYQRDHTMKTSQEHSTRIFSSHDLVEKFYEKNRPFLGDISQVLGKNYHNGDKDGEMKSVSLAHYFMKAYCDLLTKFGDKLYEFLPEPTLRDIRGVKEKDQQRPDGVVVKGKSTVVILDEVKKSLGIDEASLKTMMSLPPELDDALIQSFGYMFAFRCPLLILTDGFVYIKLRIQVGKFFENKEYYTRSQIVPYEFDMVHMNDTNFIDTMLQWFLEGNETNEEQRLGEMAEYYENDSPSGSRTKRRRTW